MMTSRTHRLAHLKSVTGYGLLSLFLCWCLATSITRLAFAQTPYGGWSNAMAEGTQAYKMHDLPKAQRMFEAAAKDAESGEKNDKRLAESLDHLGVVLFERKDYETAAKYFLRALALDEKTPNNDLNVAQRYDRLGTVSLATGGYPQADEYLRKALSLWELTLWRNDPKIAQTLEYLSAANLGMNKLPEAESFAKDALDKREKGPADPKPNVLPAIVQSAKVYIKKKDFSTAEESVRNAMKVCVLDAQPRLNVMLGDVYFNANELRKAESYYQKGLAGLKKQLARNDNLIIDCTARLCATAEKLGKHVDIGISDATMQQVRAYKIPPTEHMEIDSMLIAPPLAKDCLIGKWKGKTTNYEIETPFEMRWDGSKHCFIAAADWGAEIDYDVLYYDGTKLRMRCNGMIFEGKCDGETMSGRIEDGMGGIFLTAKNTDLQERQLMARLASEGAIRTSSEKPAVADEKATSDKIAQEVERILREREKSSAKEQIAAPATNVPKQTPVYTGPVNDKWALIIGISKFAHPEYNLKYSAKDAEDFRDYLVKEANFSPDHVRLITDAGATRENIMAAFGDQWLPRVTRPGDLVVIYISTHGTPGAKDSGGKNYIVAHDTNRDSLFATGIPMDLLSTRIKESVKTDRALIVMDTCYSGGAATGARGEELPANFSVQDIAQGTGHLVICSSGTDQRSWESKNYANGIFTHYLIEGLRQNNGKNDIKHVYSFLKDKVEWEAQRDSGARQTPQMCGQWQGADLIITVPPTSPRDMSVKK